MIAPEITLDIHIWAAEFLIWCQMKAEEGLNKKHYNPRNWNNTSATVPDYSKAVINLDEFSNYKMPCIPTSS